MLICDYNETMTKEPDLTDFPLLTEDDVRYIRQMGAPVSIRTALVTLHEGRLHFTEKGLQFYAYACQRCDLEFDPQALASEKALAELSYKLGARTLDLLEMQVAEDLAAGRTPAQDRELAIALTSKNPEDIVAATARNRECADAGDNIIPLFKKSVK